MEPTERTLRHHSADEALGSAHPEALVAASGPVPNRQPNMQPADLMDAWTVRASPTKGSAVRAIGDSRGTMLCVHHHAGRVCSEWSALDLPTDAQGSRRTVTSRFTCNRIGEVIFLRRRATLGCDPR